MADDSKRTVIGTHNGKFHCDEALACYMLQLLPEYSHAHIVRTRDSDKLKECDIVVDVGGVYDPKSHRYDHHQRWDWVRLTYSDHVITIIIQIIQWLHEQSYWWSQALDN